MSESYESNTTNIGGLFAKHLDAQFRVVTTVRSVRKATRYRPSTVVVRRDPTIVHPVVLKSVWYMDMMTSNNDAPSGDKRTRSVHAGGALRLSDLHK